MLTPHFFLFFFNDTATTEIYTLSLHDALPIYTLTRQVVVSAKGAARWQAGHPWIYRTDVYDEPRDIAGIVSVTDRKSTRLNSSHGYISYAVFCLKKKKKKQRQQCIRSCEHIIQ